MRRTRSRCVRRDRELGFLKTKTIYEGYPEVFVTERTCEDLVRGESLSQSDETIKALHQRMVIKVPARQITDYGLARARMPEALKRRITGAAWENEVKGTIASLCLKFSPNSKIKGLRDRLRAVVVSPAPPAIFGAPVKAGTGAP